MNKLYHVLTLFLGAAMAFPSLAQAQLMQRYGSTDKVAVAEDTARAIIGSTSRLTGIATTGELDLSDIGFPITVDGFRVDDGESATWAYLYSDESGDTAVGVAVVRFVIGGDQVFVEPGSGFDAGTRELDLTGEHATSEQFAAALKANETFKEYVSDYPDAIAETVVFTWRPYGAGLLPAQFPVEKPIWAIYYGTEVAELDDSSMVCFVSSGNGESYCYRYETTGVPVESPAAVGEGELAPNPVTSTASVTLSYPSRLGGPTEIRVFSIDGREVASGAHFETNRSGETRQVSFTPAGLEAGMYILRLQTTDGSVALPMQVR